MTNQEFEVCFNEVWEAMVFSKLPITTLWRAFEKLESCDLEAVRLVCGKLLWSITQYYPDNIKKLEKHCYKTLREKNTQYAFENDKLWNFKQAAKISKYSSFKCCCGMALKHLVSVFDIIEGRLSSKFSDEKFGDFINYIVLGYAILKEEKR